MNEKLKNGLLALKPAFIHTLEVAVAFGASVLLQFGMDSIIPVLAQQWPIVGIVGFPALTFLLKWLRSNPEVPLPDYVNNK